MNNTIKHLPSGDFAVMPDRTEMMQALAVDAEAAVRYTPRPYDSAARRVRPEDPGMCGVQTWSAGPIYPAIIKVEEVYLTFEERYPVFCRSNYAPALYQEERRVFYAPPLSSRLISRKFVLMIPGQEPQEFDTRGAAEVYALRMQGQVQS